MTDERRKSERRATSATFLVIHLDTREMMGRVLDVSTEGFLMASETAMAPDVTITCQMNFPYWHGLHQSVIFRATSRWCQKNIHLDWYESGWSIDQLSDVDRKIIEELTEDWETKDNRGTFRIRIPKGQ